MVNNTMNKPSFYSVLIGIDHYLPNTLPDGNSYPPLHGCVRDVQKFEHFFLRRLKHKNKYIQKLIAPHLGKDESQVPINQQPTYENMVDALQSVTKKALAGDMVWIYYAGHGGRTPTQYKAAKGDHGHDEVLVPVNIGIDTARYLRDVELGTLLKEMVDKGLIVTIVLDCCHSGGATRGNEDVAIRGISSIDTTPRPADSLVASHQILSENWLTLQRTGTRGFEISSGWLPQPEGYVLLAACRDFEGARESQLYGPYNGVFTYHLLDALQQMSPESTYKLLYDRVRAKVHAQFGEQTPQLEGERDRVVFSSELIEQIYAVNILDVQPREDHDDYYVELDAGQLHTLQEGAQFWVYPNPVRGSIGQGRTQSDQHLAYLEISELYATSSRAVISAADARRIEAGDQAMLITPGPLRFSRKVRCVRQRQFTETSNQDWALGEVEAILQQRNGAFVRLAAPAEVPDFLITINTRGIYEIQDTDGRPIHHLRPELPITLPGAAERLVERLVHLTKYRNVLLLENQSGPSSIVGKLHVELHRTQENADTFFRSEAGTSPILEPGDKLDLVITNDSWMRLHVALLDLAHDWSIKQLYPLNDTMAIEPQKSEALSLQAVLSNHYHEGTDTLKVFAAYNVTDFSWLSLPPLDQPHVSSQSRGSGPRNALEELMEFFMSERRGFRVIRKAEWEWTSVQVEIYIRRK
jgi:Caspase domain